MAVQGEEEVKMYGMRLAFSVFTKNRFPFLECWWLDLLGVNSQRITPEEEEEVSHSAGQSAGRGIAVGRNSLGV